VIHPVYIGVVKISNYSYRPSSVEYNNVVITIDEHLERPHVMYMRVRFVINRYSFFTPSLRKKKIKRKRSEKNVQKVNA